ncbi:IclR family transcriptional regulator [Glutamicibacter creatinolyticus]|uniref:IclR family transcriptional regulator n=1 Tax=Glutamicibacter creatinolyticus TaxID=162496 RepID=UPI003217EAC2
MTAVNKESRSSARTPGSDSRGASVIVNVVDVLRCFTTERPEVGVTDIAAEVGLHKSSVSRILATLEQERIVERDQETRKFRLGLGLIAITGPLLANLNVRRVAYPVLNDLCERSGETAVLNIWDGGESVSVEQIPSKRNVKHTSVMGSRYATGLSATVQMFLAHETRDQALELIDSGAISLPAQTDTGEYLKRLQSAREAGFAINYGETSQDEVGVAAPVFDHRGQLVACVMIAAPYYRVSTEVLQDLTRQTMRAAAEVSVRLGHLPGT